MASTLFNGTSRFSNDFTQVIDRSVAIASLPLTQMQQQRVKSNDESTALKTIEAKILALQGVLTGIEGSLSTRASQTSSSDNSVISASSTEGVAEGTYTLQVNKLGVFSTSVSVLDPDPAKAISDPSSGSFVTPGSTQLTVTLKDWDTGVTSVLDPATLSGTSLQDVANLINEKFGTKVKAAIVNLGTTDKPNYQLSLQSLTLGKVAMQVSDGTRDFMNVDLSNNADPSLGEMAEYKVKRRHCQEQHQNDYNRAEAHGQPGFSAGRQRCNRHGLTNSLGFQNVTSKFYKRLQYGLDGVGSAGVRNAAGKQYSLHHPAAASVGRYRTAFRRFRLDGQYRP